MGIAYEMYATEAVLGGCSLRGGEGTILGIVIGSAMMRIIDNALALERTTAVPSYSSEGMEL